MTKQEALQLSLKDNLRITHLHFLPDEWIKMISLDRIQNQDGWEISIDKYFQYRCYDDNWELYLS